MTSNILRMTRIRIPGPPGPQGSVTPELQALADAADQSAQDAALAESVAITARDDAEAARDTAIGSLNIFASSAAGIAGTTPGQYFQVFNSDGDGSTIYLNNSGVATVVGMVAGPQAIGDGIAVSPYTERVKEISGLIPGIAVDFTELRMPRNFAFSRTGTAYHRNAKGLLASVAANTPRYEHDLYGVCKGLAIENAVANELTHAEDFENWTATGAAVTTAAAISPDGTLNARFFKADGSTGLHKIVTTITAGSKSQHRGFSVWFKPAGYSIVHLAFALSDGSRIVKGKIDCTPPLNPNFTPIFLTDESSGPSSVILPSIEIWGNGWYRAQVFGVLDSGGGTNTLNVTISLDNGAGESFAGDNASGVYLSRALSRVGSTNAAMPSYAADATGQGPERPVYVDPVLFGAAEGTYTVNFVAGEVLATSVLAQIDDTTTAHRIRFLITQDTNNVNNGVINILVAETSTQAAFNIGPILPNTEHTLVFICQANNFQASLDGSDWVQGDTSGNVPTGLTTLRFGHSTSDDQLDGWIKRFSFVPKAAGDGQRTILSRRVQMARGPRIGGFGDSLTRLADTVTNAPINVSTGSAGYLNWLRILSGQRFWSPPEYNLGISGETTRDMVRRLDQVMQVPLDVVFIEAGTNDQNNGVTDVGETIANLGRIYNRFAQAGTAIVAITIWARTGGTWDDVEKAKVARVNNWIRTQAYIRSNFFVLDADQILTDFSNTSTWVAKANYLYDGVHSAPKFAVLLGRAALDVLNTIYPSGSSRVTLATALDVYDPTTDQRGNLVPNGYMIGTGGTITGPNASGILADNWLFDGSATGGAVFTLSKGAFDDGQPCQIIDLSGTYSSLISDTFSPRMYQNLDETLFAPGDMIVAECRVEVSGSNQGYPGPRLTLRPTEGSTQYIRTCNAPFFNLGSIIQTPNFAGVYQTPYRILSAVPSAMLLNFTQTLLIPATSQAIDGRVKVGAMAVRKINF